MKSKIIILVMVLLLVVSFGAPATRVEAESLPPVRIGIGGYLQEGVLNGLQTETAAQTFIDSKLNWIWMYWSHSLLGAGRPSFADALQAAGKRIILRTYWWNSGVEGLNDGNWTTLYENENAYQATLASILAQIQEAGPDDIYAVQLSEQEPCQGYDWDRSIINMDHWVSVTNRLYDDIKAQFPNLLVFVGLEVSQLGYGAETNYLSNIDPDQLDYWVRQVKKDGLHMYSYRPIPEMDIFYDLMLRYINDPDVNGELYTHTWCSSFPEPWYGQDEGYRDLDYVRDQFELAVSKGIPNIAFFAYHKTDSGTEELFFNDYEYDPLVPDYLNPYLMKQVMLELIDEYANSSPNRPPVLDSIGDKSVIEGQLLQVTISAIDPDGDTLTYSASNLPQGASFDSLTQTLSWTPDKEGNYPDIHFEVSDGSLTDTEDITITVANPNIATETLRPNAGGSNTGCNYYDGSHHPPSASVNYQQVDEEAADDGGTAIYILIARIMWLTHTTYRTTSPLAPSIT
jgi:hypothetical protein